MGCSPLKRKFRGARFGAQVRHITNIRNMCEAFNKTPVTNTLLGEVHKLLRLYLTLYLWHRPSTQELPKKQDRLNECLLMHCHKSITDTPWALLRLQRGFLVPKNYAKDILRNLSPSGDTELISLREGPRGNPGNGPFTNFSPESSWKSQTTDVE